MNEPTAAAIAYGLQEGNDGKTVAVYDLGGGTFDVSILKLSDGVFQVLSTAGDTHLGGDDFDRALLDVWLRQTNNEYDALEDVNSWLGNVPKRQNVCSAIRQCSVDTRSGWAIVSSTIERAIWEQEIQTLLDKTGDAIRLALSDANLVASGVDEVVLVGGSTRVPAVQAYVETLFERKPHASLNPDQVVALGAGMQADALSAQKSMDDDFLTFGRATTVFGNRSGGWYLRADY